jgi:hypothetical protein
MSQRGRKSTAALSVVAGTAIDGRPRAPESLTDGQREVWDRTVANEAADVFKTAALQQLLADYCRHVESAARVSAMIAMLESAPVQEWSSDHLDAYDKVLKMRDRETKASADKATKLRITNQSRYQPSTAAVKANQGAERKPWQVAS